MATILSSIRVDEDLFKSIKHYCIDNNIFLTSFFNDALREKWNNTMLQNNAVSDHSNQSNDINYKGGSIKW